MRDLQIINKLGQREVNYIINKDIYKLKSINVNIDWIIDVGANIGIFANHCSNLFPKSKIISLEPCVDIFNCLIQNTNKNKNIIPINCGFGLDGYCDPVLNESFPLASVAKPCEKKLNSIESISLKSLFEKYPINKNFILKFDCEGSEKFLVNDAFSEECIKKSVLTAIEVHFRGLDKLNESEDYFFEKFEFYNDWIIKNFSKSHNILYYLSSKKVGYGHYILTKINE